MTSRRARKRGEKRDRFTAEPSPELMQALETLLPKERDTIETHAGPVDLRKPWPLPDKRQESA